MKTLENVAFAAFLLGLLSQIDALAIIQDQLEITDEDASECRRIRILLHFFSHRYKKKGETLVFGGRHPQPVCVEVGEKRVFWYI